MGQASNLDADDGNTVCDARPAHEPKKGRERVGSDAKTLGSWTDSD